MVSGFRKFNSYFLHMFLSGGVESGSLDYAERESSDNTSGSVAAETPPVTADTEQVRDMHVEPSEAAAAVSGTPSISSIVPPQVVVMTQHRLFSPNVGDNTPLLCPGAPSRESRIVQDFLTPLIPTPPQLPRPSTSPFERALRRVTGEESMETGDTVTGRNLVFKMAPHTFFPIVRLSFLTTSLMSKTFFSFLVASLNNPCSQEASTITPEHFLGETAGPSGETRPATIDGVLIPEGVDPSFLEALPEAIRREVLAEQLALRPTPTPVAPGPSTSSGGDTAGTLNVSPEFLAALPPDVQDEVRYFNRYCKSSSYITRKTFLRILAAVLLCPPALHGSCSPGTPRSLVL